MAFLLYREFTTQQAIDTAYNPAQGLDLSAVFKTYAERGERARSTLRYVPKVPYGPTLDETLDIFPADKPGAPVLVFLHGGYWRAGSARDFSGIALGAAALGFTVVSVDYSLCPKVSMDEITRQARAAVAWVVRHIAEHNGDPERIVLAGHSAGGHLAAMCLQTDWTGEYGLPAHPIRAGLLVSGLYDLGPFPYSWLQPMLQLDAGTVARNSPMFTVRPNPAPLLLTWGGRESSEFARQSTDFLAAWQAQGNRGELLEQVDADHYTAIYGFEDPQHPLCQWLAKVV